MFTKTLVTCLAIAVSVQAAVIPAVTIPSNSPSYTNNDQWQLLDCHLNYPYSQGWSVAGYYSDNATANSGAQPAVVSDTLHDFNNDGYVKWSGQQNKITFASGGSMETNLDGNGGYIVAPDRNVWQCSRSDDRVLYKVDTWTGGYKCWSKYVCVSQ